MGVAGPVCVVPVNFGMMHHFVLELNMAFVLAVKVPVCHGVLC